MTHGMHLHRESFEEILAGKKQVEVRINDEKRQSIKVGDLIIFTLRDNTASTISVEVTQIFQQKI